MTSTLFGLQLRLYGRLNRLWGPPDLGEEAPATAFMLEAGAKVAQRYRLEKVLGAGAMGRVWLADDTQERRQVALKELRVAPGQTPDQIEASAALFRREFFAMKKLQHPNTVKVFDAGVLETGDRYLTMEVVPGRDLIELVLKKPMPSAQVFKTLSSLAQVMAFVHSRLFVHSDIKAENIRVTTAGVIKVMDFGLMHQLGTSAAGQLKGTPAYMAPEWPRGGVIDGRADLYSLGVLGFFLSTGKFPFTGQTLTQILDGHLNRPPPKPSQLAQVDPKLEQILLKLLEKAPGDRYPTASALASALAQASGQPATEEPLAARASYLHVAELVGRDAEAAQLNTALEHAQAGDGHAILLGATAGTGKSRLLQEFELKVNSTQVGG